MLTDALLPKSLALPHMKKVVFMAFFCCLFITGSVLWNSLLATLREIPQWCLIAYAAVGTIKSLHLNDDKGFNINP